MDDGGFAFDLQGLCLSAHHCPHKFTKKCPVREYIDNTSHVEDRT